MSIDHLTRQLDLIPMDCLNQRITVIGAGAIGSFVVLNLAKMGFQNITVYDFDEVSVENMNNQWYRFKDIGKPKVTSLQDLIKDFTGVSIGAITDKYVDQPLSGIVISSVDSMAVRQIIWNRCKDNPMVQWFIDPRMAAEYALSFVMDPNDQKDQISYEKTLYTDKDSVQERCTNKGTMYTSTMIAGYVVKHVKDLVTKSPYARVTHWNIATNVLQNWPKNTN